MQLPAFLRFKTKIAPQFRPSASVNPNDLSTDNYQSTTWSPSLWDGEKFSGGYGFTGEISTDYETLRVRSDELYRKNPFARGLIRRQLDNIIGNGLKLESVPDGEAIGLTDDKQAVWTEDVERKFQIWANTARLCDAKERRTFGELQQEVTREAMLEGDVLVFLRWDKKYNVPKVDFVRGSLVSTPLNQIPRKGNKIVRGIEVDPKGRHVAFWVRQEDMSHKRMPAIGEASGRRLAWMVYGSDKRSDDVRGTPTLALVMQTFKEINRYTDATLRKAVINSMFAAAITRDVESTSSGKELAVWATKKGPKTIQSSTPAGTEAFAKLEHVAPGTIISKLDPGEKMQPFSTNGTNEAAGDFINSHLNIAAWSTGLSPEVYKLEFNKSFSAAQAANNEQKLITTNAREWFGVQFLNKIYEEWLYHSVLSGAIDAQGMVAAHDDPARYNEYIAWIGCEWAGQVKPVVDIGKIVPAYALMVDRGWMTNEQATRELSGRKFSNVIKRLLKENVQILQANAPLALLGLIQGGAIAAPSEEGGDGENNNGSDGRDADGDGAVDEGKAPSKKKNKSALASADFLMEMIRAR